MASPGKAQAALEKKKAARQKKMLIILAPVLLLLMAWQGPGMLKVFGGGDPPPPPPPAAAETSATGTTAEPSGPAPSTAAPAAETSTTAAPEGGPATLPETNDPADAAPGRLLTFDRFVGKDPFRQQVSETSQADGGGSGSGKPAAGSGGSSGNPFTPPTDGGGSPAADGSAVTATRATITVNGAREVIAAGAAFPEADPTFQLVSLSEKGMKIGLVSGEFSAGAQTVTVGLGKSVTLVSEPDGIRYVIKLVSVE